MSLTGLWHTDPLYLGGMEAASVALMPDGTGWYELARAGGAEIRAFTWRLPGEDRLRLSYNNYVRVGEGKVAESKRTAEVWESAFRLEHTADRAGNDVTVLNLLDRPLGVDELFALASTEPGPLISVREARPDDLRTLWTLATLPNVGRTADPGRPIDLPEAAAPPENFADIGDPASHIAFLVAEFQGRVVGCGGIRAAGPGAADGVEIRNVRVHPATRRLGVGRTVISALERRAREVGYRFAHLDTATNMPEAMAFYEGIGYVETHRRRFPKWTLAYFSKSL
ncbi:GNAT family N-acetyltransferase [Phytomonospora sp. NPDC050363]|uniref:GNAT family N-acetyltransferase n=1 Tax=Phytomonospora sp. NPDC050363 TaxID=3155642 RepID=UPI00340EFD60